MFVGRGNSASRKGAVVVRLELRITTGLGRSLIIYPSLPYSPSAYFPSEAYPSKNIHCKTAVRVPTSGTVAVHRLTKGK